MNEEEQARKHLHNLTNLANKSGQLKIAEVVSGRLAFSMGMSSMLAYLAENADTFDIKLVTKIMHEDMNDNIDLESFKEVVVKDILKTGKAVIVDSKQDLHSVLDKIEDTIQSKQNNRMDLSDLN